MALEKSIWSLVLLRTFALKALFGNSCCVSILANSGKQKKRLAVVLLLDEDEQQT